MVMAIETGAITSALFIVTIILLLMPMYSPIAVALEMITGRAYANTLLYNLCVLCKERPSLTLT
jgi:hypothetical protein